MLRSLSALLPLTVAATSLAASIPAHGRWMGLDVGVAGPSVTEAVGPQDYGIEIMSMDGQRSQTAVLAVDMGEPDADDHSEGVLSPSPPIRSE